MRALIAAILILSSGCMAIKRAYVHAYDAIYPPETEEAAP